MENRLEKKYGLLTAICMVVGIVIGSGVFFKAEEMLGVTGGDLPVALLAWLLGGAVMVISAYVFAVMGTKYEKVNGVVDYSESLVGSKFAYYVGWFMATIYYPAMTGALAWLTARYTMSVFIDPGKAVTCAETMTLAGLFMVFSFVVNALSPKLAGVFQVSTTFIKMIPLVLMAAVGIIYGLSTGNLSENFKIMIDKAIKDPKTGEIIDYTFKSRGAGNFSALISGVCTSVFAYEGWIIATSINSEIKDSKKNLPRALILGTIIVIVVYILYYLGISGSVSTKDLLLKGGANYAFMQRFGNVAGTVLTVFIAISCFGTLNGLTVACCRGFYSLAARGQGPQPRVLASVDSESHMPSNASILALFTIAAWLFYFYIANLSEIGGKMKIFAFDSTEIPVICLYAFYLVIYVMFMVKGKEYGVFKRFIMPALAFVGACFFIYASIIKHGMKNVGFLIIALVIMVIGFLFRGKTPSPSIKADKTE